MLETCSNMLCVALLDRVWLDLDVFGLVKQVFGLTTACCLGPLARRRSCLEQVRARLCLPQDMPSANPIACPLAPSCDCPTCPPRPRASARSLSWLWIETSTSYLPRDSPQVQRHRLGTRHTHLSSDHHHLCPSCDVRPRSCRLFPCSDITLIASFVLTSNCANPIRRLMALRLDD